jgi:two-component system, NtrC family, nitrogen regulation sensor histidine kinase GlnL
MTGDAIWLSLPMPALLVDASDRISAANPAAETFLNLSERNLLGQMLLERLLIDAPMEDALTRVRQDQSPLVIAEADVTTGERPPQHCALHLSPLQGTGAILILIAPRDIADRLGRSMQVTSAAKSAIGMAEMLAHEIKNPLAGISGAAQLLAMGLGPKTAN